MMNKTDLLAKVSLFSLMKDKDLQRIADQTRDHTFRNGDIIIREGARDWRLFVIVRGRVEVIKGLGGRNERYVRTLGPFTYFGEMALIDGMVRSATVVAKEDTQALSLEHLNLRQEIEQYPAMAFELLQVLSRRIRAVEETLVNRFGVLLPTCANCRKIREDNGSWTSMEVYIEEHSEAEFSHGICPECAQELYPEYAQELYPGH